MIYDEMNHVCVYPYGILMLLNSLKESFRMRSDMSKAAPSFSYARAKGVALSCILFENNFTRKPMTIRRDQGIQS